MRGLLALLCLFLFGCAVSMSQLTAPNRENLLKLSIGMDKTKAIDIMGTKSFKNPMMSFSSSSRPQDVGVYITNPYRSEVLQGKDKTFEIIYYVTDVKSDDGAITDDELTPLVFDNGALTGWGWSFLEENIQKYEIRVR